MPIDRKKVGGGRHIQWLHKGEGKWQASIVPLRKGAARLSVSMGGGTDRIIGFIEGRGRGQEY